MADQIFTGSGFKLFYNDDTANRIPDNAGNELVNELAAMPSFGIDSQVQTIEVYNSEFSEKLLAEQNVNNIDIVVNYVPDCTAHAFLDQATEDQTEFQLTLQYAVTDGIISYSMVNGMISSARLTGDKDSVVTKSYTFTPTDVLVRDGQAPLSTGLVVGSYGVGSNGVDVPQYEPQLPNGNSFIKVPAARNDNPASADLMGIGLIDSGTFSSIAMTKSGTLAIYAKNQNTAWTRILTATQISDQYVPITRKINGKALNADITITKSDVGLGNVTNDAQLKAASNLSDLTDVAAAKTVLGIKGAANFDIIPITNGGTGATTAAAARTNLGLGTAATYNIGTSGSTVPLLNAGTNTWSGTNDFNYATFKSTAATPLKISSNNPTMMFEDANAPNYKAVLVLDGETFRIHEEGTSGPVILNYNYLNKTTTFTKLALSNALEVGQGGTGARLPEDARTNLGAFYERQSSLLSGDDLNDLNGRSAGVYNCAGNAIASLDRNYPVAVAGALTVLRTNANSMVACVQTYVTFDHARTFIRTNNGTPLNIGTWSAWKETFTNGTIVPVANGGTGATTAAQARTNLGLVRFVQSSGDRSVIQSTDVVSAGCYLQLDATGRWGYYNPTSNNWQPLGLEQGGTGARIPADARTNLQAFYENKVALTTQDLNTLNGNFSGLYQQPSISNALLSRNYPIQQAGSLQIYQTGANGTQGAVQVYITYNEARTFKRTMSNGTSWNAWKEDNTVAALSGILPIVAGGTGAATAADTRTNLGVAGLADNNTYTAANTYNGKTNFNGDITVSGNFDNSASKPLTIKSANPTMSFVESDASDSTYMFVADGGNFRLNRDNTGGAGIFNYTRTSNSLSFGVGTVSVAQLTASGIVSGGITATSSGYANMSIITTGPGDNKVGSRNVLEVTTDGSLFYLVRRNNLNSTGQYVVTFPSSGGTLALAGTSDANFKRDIKNVDGSQSLENIRKVNPVTFIYTEDDKARTRRGVIAQELELIDPNYVKHTKEISEEVDENGDPIMRERLVVDNNPLLMDTVISTKLLAEENDLLKAQIADQQLQLDELRAVVTQLLIAQNK
ncbi:pyocin knob domain-containing S74 family peptidase [Escherichia fergusonii]|uniref:pyocin knob domain-containing S74 family peptidase n=1 Tax=Escherichia fergusonii TaxID=564 RepID=UPI001495CAD9|nr:pyocin knob domain-containing S74 family peptidase [Escherichia fergusonii]QKD65704.1 tail fiber domain-containing protein [Escherichia fergusonii]